jgi:hypothetical protein
MANDKQIIDDVKASVEGLTGAFGALAEMLKTNLSTQKDLIKDLAEIRKQYGSTKEIANLIKLKKEHETAEANLTKKQKEALQLTKLKDSIDSAAAKTKQAAINAAMAQERQQEAVIQAKMRTENMAAAQKARLNKEQEKATKTARDAASAYVQQSRRLAELTRQAKDAAVAYGVNSKQARALRNEQQKLDATLKSVDKSLGLHQRNVGNYGSALQGVTGKLMGAFGIVGGLQLLSKELKNAYNITKDYEKANAELAGVLGKNIKETASLQKSSKKLGATTAFSAKEVTGLQIELARMGKTESEIIQMTEGIIDASIALGSSASDTAGLVAASLNAYQLEAKDSARVADILTLSTQRSALSFSSLHTALPIVAGAAKAAGYSLEDTVAMLGQAADRGIDASTSATALRNIFIELSAKGLTLDQALKQINNSQNKLSEATDLFGQRSAITALALADNVTKTKDLTEALENAGGTAKSVAETQLKTLDGQLRLLNSAWEGLILTISKENGALTKFVGFMTNAVIGMQTLGTRFEMITKSAKKWSDATVEQIVNFGTMSKSGESVSKTLEDIVKNYNKLPEAVRETISLNQFLFENLQKLGEKMDESRRLADYYTKSLEDLAESTNNNLPPLEDLEREIESVIKVENDLIKIQEALLVKAREMSGATEEEIALRNRKVTAIEAEISRLRALGQLQQVEPINLDATIKQLEADIAELDALDDIEIKKYLEKEQEKTRIIKEETDKRDELQKKAEQDVYEFSKDAMNGLFERRNVLYDRELDANTKYYDNILANQQLDEEQRSLIEAQREQKENVIREKQKQNELKQFKFNQSIKIGEVAVNTLTEIAKIKAAAAVHTAALNPVGAGIALSQIPFVKLSGALAIGSILAQTLPAFAKGTKNAPEGFAKVGEEGVELVIEPNKKAWFTSDREEIRYLKKGSQVITNDELVNAVSNTTNNQIVNNGDVKNDKESKLIAAMVTDLLKENKRGTKQIVNAVKSNRHKQDSTINKLRTEDLRRRMQN